jgi:hypothetical protein
MKGFMISRIAVYFSIVQGGCITRLTVPLKWPPAPVAAAEPWLPVFNLLPSASNPRSFSSSSKARRTLLANQDRTTRFWACISLIDTLHQSVFRERFLTMYSIFGQRGEVCCCRYRCAYGGVIKCGEKFNVKCLVFPIARR